MTDMNSPQLPRSHVTATAGFSGVACLSATLAIALAGRWPSEMTMAAAVGAAFFGCMMAEGLPFFVHSLKTRAPRFESRSAVALRIARKLVGLLALFGIAVAAFRIFPYFSQSRLAAFASDLARPFVLFVAAVVCCLYVTICDRLMGDPDDSLHQVGNAVLMQAFRPQDVLFALRCLAIKLFFLTLMWTVGVSGIEAILSREAGALPFLSADFFLEATRLLFLLDAILAAVGYLATLRLFDWHVRATETTALGWVACLICYPPFFNAVEAPFLPYGAGPDWHSVIEENTIVFTLWSTAIIACNIVFVWATAAFGARFSNLSNRGIVTHGPYRFVRHPAYLAKNLSWWLLALPGFYASGIEDGLVRGAMLAIFTGIYVLRALAEEKMLSRDPAYMAYALQVADHGLWARLTRRTARVHRRSTPPTRPAP
jgi:protein-S-isoprenylcysteine O-methyltransferase Ste14